MAFNERTLMVMGEDVYNRIVKKHIVLVGVGGVGGAVFECLVRFGIEKITIIIVIILIKSPIKRRA